ncbi:ATP-binding protein [Mucilaginibacter sp. E4BP6]|uniref:ATP-binding protein n=1 Tax=Mucilaginibacter sp. E4BP6 TaxID=2723089 RepID=UPI0015CC7857|nr:ATP-binding protein [Mucilaginibacter sp. E4BP6]NYE67223.1 hypothetical protein [Mucilaginibacter sp. E4BP6]
MADTSSVFSTGDGGGLFEHSVQNAFLTTMLVGGQIPFVQGGVITEMALQTTRLGYKTDDLYCLVQSETGSHRLLVQAKYTVSITGDNKIFREVISDFWQDFNHAELFNQDSDKLILIKNGLTAAERNHVLTLLNWAKAKACAGDFMLEVNRIGAKKEKLEVFAKVVNLANQENPVTDEQLWKFLRCLIIQEYDFGNAASIDHAYFLNLIRLTKSGGTTVSAGDIWNHLIDFITQGNKDGASFTLESIKREAFYSYFDHLKLSPVRDGLLKLISDGQLLLNPIKNNIQGLRINRISKKEEIVAALNTHRFTFLTGKPGLGKTSIISEILSEDFSDAAKFIFKADQFNEPHLATVFVNEGVFVTVADLIAGISLWPQKIVFIDSLEKLLEGTPENAFAQLMSALEPYKDIRIIASSRTYAVDLVASKYGLESVHLVDLPPLTTDELGIVRENFPDLSPLLNNKSISGILRSPKYLDFTIPLLSKSNNSLLAATLPEFKNALWRQIVENETVRSQGYPARRRKTFTDIVIKRAKNMSLFVTPDHDDPEIVDLLEHDGLIFSGRNPEAYAPTHDILEDWALVRHVDAVYNEHDDPLSFLLSLGNEPAIRRAFRLWVDDNLIDKEQRILELIAGVLASGDFDKYWTDELITAVFRSEVHTGFFQFFSAKLLAGDDIFFIRCIQLLRTTCKEIADTESDQQVVLIPVGTGWTDALKFMGDHIDNIKDRQLWLLITIQDWVLKFRFKTSEVYADELANVKKIILFLVEELKGGNKFWEDKTYLDLLVRLLLEIAETAKIEISQLFREAEAVELEHVHNNLSKFYKELISGSLSGLFSKNIAKALPDTLLTLIEKKWKATPPDYHPGDFPDDHVGRLIYEQAKDKWGIASDDLEIYPPGIFRIPIFNLLTSHPKKTIKFIIEFLNYNIDSNLASADEGDGFQTIKIILNNGELRSVYGSSGLWNAYRGISATHYLIESILISLEKYLLDVAGVQNEGSKKYLNHVFDYIIDQSNSVLPLSVVASIGQAFPSEIEAEFLPLFSSLEIYDWDSERAFSETQSMAIYDSELPFAQEEKIKSNNLPHRRKYSYGLQSFVIDYQLLYRQYNTELFSIFDRLKHEADHDIVSKKNLYSIDIRNWEATVLEDQNKIQIAPAYEGEVKIFLESHQSANAESEKAAGYSLWIGSCYKVETIDLKELAQWRVIWQYYQAEQNFDYFYAKPVALANIGLRFFQHELTPEEINWSTETLSDAVLEVFKASVSRDYRNLPRLRTGEKNVALESVSILYKCIKDTTDKQELLILLIGIMLHLSQDFEFDYLAKNLRQQLFRDLPDIGRQVIDCLIHYAAYRKEHPYFLDHFDQAKVNAAIENELAFVKGIITTEQPGIDYGAVTFDTHEAWVLKRALLISPYQVPQQSGLLYIRRFLTLFLAEIAVDDHMGYRRPVDRQLVVQHKKNIQDYFVELLLYAGRENAQDILDQLLNTCYQTPRSVFHRYQDTYSFVDNILNAIVWKVNDIAYSDAGLDEDLNESFWQLWGNIFESVTKSGKIWFPKYLLLDMGWTDVAIEWKPLTVKYQSAYLKIAAHFAGFTLGPVINVFGSIGQKLFLPAGLKLIVGALKNTSLPYDTLSNSGTERLAKRLYRQHMVTIKEDKELLKDFLYLLNNMVSQGSSIAYMIREDVITYKSE